MFGAYSWFEGRGNEIKSALHPLLPILVAIQLLIFTAVGISIYGLANKRKWSINWGIVCLALSGLSVLLPVAVIGIWALIDSRVKQYLILEKRGITNKDLTSR